jgi:hypothetical protein
MDCRRLIAAAGASLWLSAADHEETIGCVLPERSVIVKTLYMYHVSRTLQLQSN